MFSNYFLLDVWLFIEISVFCFGFGFRAWSGEGRSFGFGVFFFIDEVIMKEMGRN